MIDDPTKPIHVSVDPATQAVEEEASRGGIDLVALAVSFLEQWRTAVIVAVLVAIVCFAYVFSLKPKYVATATILPQQGRSSETFASLFYRGSGVAGLYQGLLKSRTVQDLVIQRANLLNLYHTSDMQAARGMLASTSIFASTPDGLMTVSVRDNDARDAATIANAYLDALKALNENMGRQQSDTTRIFFENQLAQERVLLQQAENRYQQLQKQTGLVDPSAQIASGIGAIQSIRQNIDSLQVQRSALLESETPENPEVRALDSRIATLQAQERAQESSSGSGPTGAAPSATQALQQRLELQRAERDVTYYTTQVGSLANEFETARLDEAAGRSAFQVVDLAIPPQVKDWPPRKPYLLFSVAIALLVGLAAVIFKLLAMRVMAHALLRERLSRLRGAFR